MKTTLYYFSATGNTLKVALEMQKEFPEAILKPIPLAIMNCEFQDNSDVIGFFFPVYWLGLPSIVWNFLEKIEIEKAQYIFAVNTFVGLNGISRLQTNKILTKKNKKLNFGMSIRMPGSNLTFHPPMPHFINEILIKRSNKQIDKLIEKIKSWHTEKIKKEIFIPNFLINLSYNWFIKNAPILDKKFRINHNCTKCGVCIKVCPVGNIKLTDGNITWENNCEFCLACMHWCPQKSIQYGKTDSNNRYHHPDINLKQLIYK